MRCRLAGPIPSALPAPAAERRGRQSGDDCRTPRLRRGRATLVGVDPAQAQPQLGRLVVHAAGRRVPAPVSDLPAGPRHLAELHRYQDRPQRRLHRPRELRLAVGRPGILARGLQHLPLYDRRQRVQIRPRPLSCDPAQPLDPVQGVHPGDRAAAVHRADGALGDRLLVDLRQPVLDHQLVAR